MKTEEVSTITNTVFVALPDKARIRLAAVIKKIDDKETASGTAKRFKGELAMIYGDITYLARYGFFPTPIREAIYNAAQKLGKWSSFEFVLSAVKSVSATGATVWTVTFETPARIEMPRVMALLENK